ncbi:MAG: hypothetical protein R2724_12170 [Bryobacterales bacterium]
MLLLAALLAAWTRGLPSFFAFSGALLLLPNFRVWLQTVAGTAFGLPALYLPALGLLALFLLVVQYATRRRTLGILIGVPLACVVAIGAFRFDPYAALRQNPVPELEPIQVQLLPGPGRSSFAVESVGAMAGRVMDVWFVPEGLAVTPDRALELSRMEGEIEWDDGRTSPFYATGDWSLESRLGELPLWCALAVQGDEAFTSLLGRSGNLQGRAVASVWRVASTERLRLEPGVEARYQSAGLRILHIERAPGGLRVRLRSREVVNLWHSSPRLRLALVDPVGGERLPLEFDGDGKGFRWGGLLISPPLLVAAKQGLWRPFGTGESAPDWLAEAELELRFYEFSGRAEVNVKAADLHLAEEETGAPGLYSLMRVPWF